MYTCITINAIRSGPTSCDCSFSKLFRDITKNVANKRKTFWGKRKTLYKGAQFLRKNNVLLQWCNVERLRLKARKFQINEYISQPPPLKKTTKSTTTTKPQKPLR